MSEKGFLIVIDGLDGTGKNTQATILYNFLKDNGVEKIIKISFPDYESYTGKIIRDMLTSKLELNPGLWKYHRHFINALLFSYDRMICMNRKMPEYNGKSLNQLYKEGYVIICDRYTTSNFFHMTTGLSYIDTKLFIDELEDLEYEKMCIIKPDLVMILSLDPKISMQLIEKRGNEKDDHENLTHLQKAYEKLNEVLKIKKDWKVINCNNEEGNYIRASEDIQHDIRSVLRDCVAIELIEDIINKIDNLDTIKNEYRINTQVCPECKHEMTQLLFEPEKYYCPKCESVRII